MRDRYVLQARLCTRGFVGTWRMKRSYQFASGALDVAAHENRREYDYQWRVIKRIFGAKGSVVGYELLVPEMWP